jgi:DNA-binding NarL/FixJ family response regulator
VSRIAQKDGSASKDRTVDADRFAVALIVREGSRDRISAILEEQGLDFGWFEKIEDLEGAASPALIVLCVDGTLSSAIGRDVEPLLQASEGTPVVIVCDEVRPGELRASLAAGVSGIVLEEQLASTLGPSLEAARAGQVCVPRQHTRQIEPAALSPREKQILGLVVMGYMNGQIAEQLFLAESTVKSHLSSAFGKLGVRSRNEAVDLILDPDRGLGMGILALGGEPVEAIPTAAR